MAGYRLQAQDTHDDAKLTQFVGNVNSLFNRIDLLSRWAVGKVRTNLERISVAEDMSLPVYLALVREQRGKEKAFEELVRYLLKTIRKEENR